MQNFNNTRHDYEITLEPGTVIEPCEEEEAVIPKMQYHVSPRTSFCFKEAVFYHFCCPLLRLALVNITHSVSCPHIFGSLQFTKIKQVNDVHPNTVVDVMGIVDRVEPSAIIQTRDSREVSLAIWLPCECTTQEASKQTPFSDMF